MFCFEDVQRKHGAPHRLLPAEHQAPGRSRQAADEEGRRPESPKLRERLPVSADARRNSQREGKKFVFLYKLRNSRNSDLMEKLFDYFP